MEQALGTLLHFKIHPYVPQRIKLNRRFGALLLWYLHVQFVASVKPAQREYSWRTPYSAAQIII
jgi:hypothetical protein